MIFDPFLGEPVDDPEYVWAQWAGTDFLICRRRELERFAADKRRNKVLRLEAKVDAIAIRQELSVQEPTA